MRVLVVHNRYSSSMPSGENRVVDDEIAALRVAGVEVESLMPTSDSIAQMNVSGKLAAALSPVFGLSSSSALNRVLKSFRPDVVHLHNPYPLISPTAITACNRAGVPVVATIHNFRLRCINGLFYRDGRICTDCDDRRVALPGLVHGCYRGSRAQSAVMVAAVARHRSTWDGVSRYIAVSRFVADRLVEWGVSQDNVVVNPNPVEDPGVPTPIGDGFLYAGRLSEEKGILQLLDAWQVSGLGASNRLLIAGDGPLRGEVEAMARSMSGVFLKGPLPAEEVVDLRRATSVGIYASTCYEAHPAIAESFACARPVVATSVGALGTLVDDKVGWCASSGSDSLAAALIAATDPTQAQLRGSAARERYLQQYRSSTVIANLLKIFESVIQ